MIFLEQLSRYQERWPEETSTVQKFRDFVKQHPDCFERTLTKGHITGSGLVFHPPTRKVLLTHHAKLNRWLQLGGHSDGHPLVHETALRECEEESGLASLHLAAEPPEIFDLDIHEIPARKTEPAHLHYDVRFLVVSDSLEFKVSNESLDLKWFDEEEVFQITSEESMHRQFRKLKMSKLSF